MPYVHAALALGYKLTDLQSHAALGKFEANWFEGQMESLDVTDPAIPHIIEEGNRRDVIASTARAQYGSNCETRIMQPN